MLVASGFAIAGKCGGNQIIKLELACRDPRTTAQRHQAARAVDERGGGLGRSHRSGISKRGNFRLARFPTSYFICAPKPPRRFPRLAPALPLTSRFFKKGPDSRLRMSAAGRFALRRHRSSKSVHRFARCKGIHSGRDRLVLSSPVRRHRADLLQDHQMPAVERLHRSRRNARATVCRAIFPRSHNP